MTKILQQALVNVHDAILRGNTDGELLSMIDDALRDAKAHQEQPASVDAYVGAREDAAIWKKRALEAEGLNRKFIAEVNGPTYLGEPAQPAQEPDPVLCKFYQVTTFEELVSAQEHHINKMQAKLKKENDNGMGSILVRKSRAASDQWSGCTVVGCVASESQTGQVAKDQQEQPAQEPVAWDGAEGWEPLAWHLCAEENGEEACNELIWEGGATPEPWGDRWLKYEHAAKQMIATVKKFAAPTQPALKDDIGVACLETMVKTMTNLGIATDASIEGFGARLESNIYAMCRTVDGIFKAQQEQPAQEASATWTEMVVVNLVREGVNKHRARELAAHFLTLPTQPALSDEEILAMNAGEVFFSESPSKYPEAGHGTQYHAGAPGVLKFARAIEAHCRGGANG